ncbi:MAG: hypothetical protein U0894_13920 [Pirellulales bacterium]
MAASWYHSNLGCTGQKLFQLTTVQAVPGEARSDSQDRHRLAEARSFLEPAS